MLHKLKNGKKISSKSKNFEKLEKNVEFKDKQDVISKIDSPDFDYVEAFQRGLSNLTNNSDEIQVSEKYNFDALTSSIEESSTSCSKKTVNFLKNYSQKNVFKSRIEIKQYKRMRN